MRARNLSPKDEVGERALLRVVDRTRSDLRWLVRQRTFRNDRHVGRSRISCDENFRNSSDSRERCFGRRLRRTADHDNDADDKRVDELPREV
jgi:hypothetical protein